jgi:hypothetical protein
MKSMKIIIRLFFAVIMMTSFTTLTSAQSIEGDWYGKANVMGTDLRINLHIKTSGNVYTCTWDSPDQGGFGLPATTTTFTYPDFAFTYDEAGIKYSGKVDPGYTEIKGILYQSGQKFDILFGRKEIPPAPENK